jgi:hypothetical protein
MLVITYIDNILPVMVLPEYIVCAAVEAQKPFTSKRLAHRRRSQSTISCDVVE